MRELGVGLLVTLFTNNYVSIRTMQCQQKSPLFICSSDTGGQERALKGKSCRFIGGGGGAQNEATSALGGLGQHRTEKKRQESWASLLERDGILGFW